MPAGTHNRNEPLRQLLQQPHADPQTQRERLLDLIDQARRDQLRTREARLTEARALHRLGLLALHEEGLQPALSHFQRAIRLFRAQPLPQEEAASLTRVAQLLLAAGNDRGAQQVAERLLQQGRAHQVDRVRALLAMGMAHLSQHQAGPAWHCVADLAVEAAEGCSQRRMLAAALGLRAWLELNVVTARAGLRCHIGLGLGRCPNLPALHWRDVQATLDLAAQRDPSDPVRWNLEACGHLMHGLQALQERNGSTDGAANGLALEIARQLGHQARLIRHRSAFAAGMLWLHSGVLLRLSGRAQEALEPLQLCITTAQPRQLLSLVRSASYETSLACQALGRLEEALQALHRHCELQHLPAETFPQASVWGLPNSATAPAAMSGPLPPSHPEFLPAPNLESDPSAGADSRSPAWAHVRAAEACIDAQLHLRVRVDAVAAHCGCSRRTLEMAFRQVRGGSVGECIRRLRLERALEKIQLTQLPMGDIALAVGYANASQLSRDCSDVYGAPPQQLRREYRQALEAMPDHGSAAV
jgi:AraC-like DNA-binding protein